jgi:hypothetical protein
VAKYSSKDVAFFLVGGYSLLGFQTDLTVSKEAVLEDSTVLGLSWETRESVGLRRATVEQNGFFDDAALGNNVALVTGASTGPGSDRVLVLGVAGNAIGRAFTGVVGALQAVYDRVVERGALHKANARYLITGQVDEGVILHALGPESGATGNTETTPADNGAQTTAGMVGYLQVSQLVLGGYTSFNVKLRSSPDNVTYSDVAGGAFAAVTSSATAQRIVPSIGTVPRYLAISWSYAGAGAGQSATFMVGASRN